jgi:tetratricopeptide (TPR) repeat protein
MKFFSTLLLPLLSIYTFGQKMSIVEWEEEAKTNSRLLPKYGNIIKTEAQKGSDQEFIESVLVKDSTRKKASDHLIKLGFAYLYKDIKTAMYRFNQAYLLDSTNTDIYWGFGGVYFTLGDYAKAEKQYKMGLAINPNNTHLLTDYGTYFMGQYYGLKSIDKKSANANLDSAIVKMMKSFQLDHSDQNTTFKLSVCYWNKGDCKNALKYYDICKALGGKPITEEYTQDLKKKCN